MNKTKHILRYGTTAEQKYLDGLIGTYDLLAINANMFAHASSSISSFIFKTFIKKDDKGYFIDPMTHSFQHNLDMIRSSKTHKIKKSISKLITAYGEPLINIVSNENRTIVPSDFNGFKEEFCRNVVAFQQQTVIHEMEKKGFKEYIDFDPSILSKAKPEFIVAPYFYLDGDNDWLELNIEFINITKQLYNNENVFAELVVSKSILHDDCFLNKICEAYSSLDINGILIWVDDFKEHEVSPIELGEFAKLVKNLKSNGLQVFNLYGGFYSISLTSFEDELGFRLDGVGHGLEYGESRAVIPVGGGIPTSKYYYYPLHNRLDYRTSANLLRSLGILNSETTDEYFKDICNKNCPSCSEVLKEGMSGFTLYENTLYYEVKLRGTLQRRPYASAETKHLCLFHYQFCKSREFIELDRLPLEQFLNNIMDTYKKYLDLKILNKNNLLYLLNWHNALNKLYKGEN